MQQTQGQPPPRHRGRGQRGQSPWRPPQLPPSQHLKGVWSPWTQGQRASERTDVKRPHRPEVRAGRPSAPNPQDLGRPHPSRVQDNVQGCFAGMCQWLSRWSGLSHPQWQQSTGPTLGLPLGRPIGQPALPRTVRTAEVPPPTTRWAPPPLPGEPPHGKWADPELLVYGE